MEQEVKLYVKRLETSRTLRRADDPAVEAYLMTHPGYQDLYIEVQPPIPVLEEEFWKLRLQYSQLWNLNMTLLKRLLTVRTEWSKK